MIVDIKLYEVSLEYVDYLTVHAPHFFRNRAARQFNERTYVGVIPTVNGMNSFAPLSPVTAPMRPSSSVTPRLRMWFPKQSGHIDTSRS